MFYPQMERMCADEGAAASARPPYLGVFICVNLRHLWMKWFGISKLWSGWGGCLRTPVFEDGGEFFGKRGEEVVR